MCKFFTLLPKTVLGRKSSNLGKIQSFSERRSNKRRSERALIIDERERERIAKSASQNDERERKLALIF